MRHTLLCVLLIANVLVCPYACTGSLWTSGCSDACCPATDDKSSGNVPDSPRNSCDGSCGNCLCGGAVPTGSCITVDDSSHNSVDALPCTAQDLAMGTARAAGRLGSLEPGDLRAGVMLRALLQSFLL